VGAIHRSVDQFPRVAKLFLAAALLALPSAVVAQGSTKPHIAVLTFEGDETTTSQQRSAITDRLQMELINSGSFVVLDRNKIDEILREQGFQKTGACTSSECQVEMGQLLGVEKLVSGKVVNFGPVWSLTVQMTDVGSGKIERSEAEDVKGELYEVVGKGCPSLAKKLASKRTIADGAIAEPATVPSEVDPSAAVAEMKPSKPSSRLKWGLAGGLLLAGVGSAVYGYLEEQAIAEKRDAYDRLTSADADPVWVAARNDLKKAEDAHITLRNIGYGLGAALAASGIAIAMAF